MKTCDNEKYRFIDTTISTTDTRCESDCSGTSITEKSYLLEGTVKTCL